jgi:hypothetical protein
LKVDVLEVDDAVNLLLHRSRIGAAGETLEAKAEAADIVKELGYLALAIEQAAALSVKPRGTYSSSFRIIARIENFTTHGCRREINGFIVVQFRQRGICRLNRSRRITRTPRRYFVSCRF